MRQWPRCRRRPIRCRAPETADRCRRSGRPDRAARPAAVRWAGPGPARRRRRSTADIGQRRQRRNKTQNRAGQAAVHPGARAGRDSAADGQLGPVSVDAQAQAAQRADHQVGIAAAQRSADGRGAPGIPPARPPAPRAPACGWSAISSRERSPSRAQGIGATGAGHVLTGPSSLVGACRRHLTPWSHVWAFRSHDRSGPAGRENQGDRRGHRCFSTRRITTSRPPIRSRPS